MYSLRERGEDTGYLMNTSPEYESHCPLTKNTVFARGKFYCRRGSSKTSSKNARGLSKAVPRHHLKMQGVWV